jgi:hypothetical protein
LSPARVSLSQDACAATHDERANCPNLKGFRLVLHCHIVALSALMPTQNATPTDPARPDAPAVPGAKVHPSPPPPHTAPPTPREIGGRAGPDPTRFGDWEKGGRCIDF